MKNLKILFVHQNFPGQYLHLARYLGSTGNEVVFITQRANATMPGVRTIFYKPQRAASRQSHHYLRGTESGVLNAQAVARVALKLKRAGFVPDVMVGHNGWGEIWYLKDIYPRTPLLGYFEFFYRFAGADVGFDPQEPPTADDAPRVRTKNAGNLLGLDAADWGQCPTQWQLSTYPECYRSKLSVVHEGIDTDVVVPDGQAHLRLPGSEVVAGDEVVTYVARNLEPYRGFPIFMRSLPAILRARPKARVLIVGGDQVNYGKRLPPGQTFRQRALEELGDSLDLDRVHFLGKVPYPVFLKVLQVSRAHVYLTYPFVLSWSMLEAMSAGCLVVGSRTPPVEEVIRDDENGLLVDFFRSEEIADRVIKALAEPALFAKVRARARDTVVETYDLRRICLPEQLKLIAQMVDKESIAFDECASVQRVRPLDLRPT